MLVGWKDATTLFGVLGADSFAVRFAPGSAASAQPALEEAARELALEPNTLDAVRGAIGDALGQVFGLFDALAIVAVLVAGLGIVNTLTMNVVERVREIGVLRATGMTRSQVWRMIVIEAGVLGVIGAVLGCLAGLGAGAALIALTGGGIGARASISRGRRWAWRPSSASRSPCSPRITRLDWRVAFRSSGLSSSSRLRRRIAAPDGGVRRSGTDDRDVETDPRSRPGTGDHDR